MGDRLGRTAHRAQPLQRAEGQRARKRRAPPPLRRGVPPVRRRLWLPLRISRTAPSGRVRDHGRADRIPLSVRPQRLVDARARTLLREPRPPHPHLADGHGQHAAHAGMRRRRVSRPARGRSDGLRQNEPLPRRNHPALPPHPVVHGGEGLRPDAFPHAVAHDDRRRHAGRSGNFAAHAQPQRAVPHRGHLVDPPRQICRHLVVDASLSGDLGAGTPPRRHDRKRETLHRLRRETRHRGRAGRGVERRLGRRVDQKHGPDPLHGALSGLRHRSRCRLRRPKGRGTDRPPRNGGRYKELRGPAGGGFRVL